MCIILSHLFDETSTGLHNSPSQRQKFLAWIMTSLSMSVLISKILPWPWGRLGCYECVYWHLSQLCSTRDNLKCCILVSWEATFPLTRVHQVGLQPVLCVHHNWDILRVETQLFFILAVCLLILRFFSSEKKIIWFRLAHFLLVCNAFSKGARVAYTANMFL